MNNLDKLKELAEKMPKGELRENALSLVERMGEVIDGIGDEPVRWRPGNLQVAQGTSDYDKMPEGAKLGDLVAGGEILKQPVKFIPLRMWKARQRWSPDQNDAKMLCSSPDGEMGFIGVKCRECPHSKFDEEAGRSACSRGQQALVITDDLKHIFVDSFFKTSSAVGKDFEGLMKKAGVATYKRVYSVKTETSSKYKNVRVQVIEPAGAVEAHKLEFLAELFRMLTEDRKEFLTRFYEMVESRQQNQAQLLLANQHDDSDETVLVIEQKPEDASAEQTDMTKKYAL
jgi:hypothetical protein